MVKRSRRIPDDLSPNRLAAARARIGDVPFDLTGSNPTLCGIEYPSDLVEGLADPAGLTYRPAPHGPESTREVVAALYRRWGLEVAPNRVTLTASTSEAYSFLFRLLCEPGDTVLVPSPSYPLFDQLARLDSVATRTYALDHEAGWRIEFSDLERAPDCTRAVVVVHPNNPTGSHIHPADAHRLVDLCRSRGWALIADEVFLPYSLSDDSDGLTSFAGVSGCLCFALGGLSKMVGLPQLKLAWIVAGGPADLVGRAREGLEYVADTYLSVATPVALAAVDIFERGRAIRRQIRHRCRRNFAALNRLAADHPASSIPDVHGGWSAMIRIPAIEAEEDLCLRLLGDFGVAAHPGFFYDFPRDGFLVVSLLTPEKVFEEGVRRIFDAVNVVMAEPSGCEPEEC